MVMNQNKNTIPSSQVKYLDRWVDKKHFRAFVYSATDQHLVESWNEFEEKIASGLWFSTKSDALKAIPAPENEEVKPQIKKSKQKVVDKLNQAATLGS